MYQDCPLGTGTAATFGVGNFLTADIVSHGGQAGWASSLKITSGYCAILYQGDNFTGSSVALSADISCLTTTTPVMNDLVSSLKVIAGACPTATPTPRVTNTATATNTPTATRTPTATQTSPPANIGSIVTSAQFDQIWPTNRSATYTYADFVTAITTYYPALCGTGTTTQMKRECAAYFGSKDQETGMGQYDRELYCQPGGGGYGSAPCDYCDTGNAPCGTCASGQKYWGRHAVQLSWNYNYCNAGNGMGLGTGLHTDPNSIFNNKVTGWRASDWYWMTQLGPAVTNGYGTWPQESAHAAITSTASGLHGYGGIMRAVNGVIECQSRVPQQINRVHYFVGTNESEANPSAGSTAKILGYVGTTADGISGQHLWCSP
jgi:hypothetical protein